MRHPILAMLLLIFGIGVAIAGGPVAWVLLVILSPLPVMLVMAGKPQTPDPRAHFAATPRNGPRVD